MAGLSIPAESFAKNGKSEGKGNKDGKFRIALVPADSLSDLAAAKGKVDFFKKSKGTSNFKIETRLPLVAASIGLDSTTAPSLDIRVEFLQEAVAVLDCALELNEPDIDELEPQDHHKFRLRANKKGKVDAVHVFKKGGPCAGTATLSDITKDDDVNVYLLDVDQVTRIPILVDAD